MIARSLKLCVALSFGFALGDEPVADTFDILPPLVPKAVDWEGGEPLLRGSGYNVTSPLESLGFPFLDGWFASKCVKLFKLSDYLLRVLYAPPSAALPPDYTVRAGEAFAAEPIYCDVVIFTGHDTYDLAWGLYDTFRVAYARQTPGTCVFNIHSGVTAAELRLGFPGQDRVQWSFNLMERYRAGLILIELIAQGRIVAYNNNYPTLLYFDADAFPTNRYLTVDDVWDKFRVGIRRPTAEERVCSAPDRPEDMYCGHRDPNPKNIGQIGFSVPIEAHCHKEYAVNSGVWFTRPSRLVTLILGSTILSAQARVKHPFDDGDQGFMNYALSQLFGFDYAFLQGFCMPFNYDYFIHALKPAESEIYILRQLRVEKSKEHPVFGRFVSEVFARTAHDFMEGEPRYAAWVTPRWHGSFGCPWFLSDPARYLQGWHPGDFAVHFASCNHAGATSYWWRRLVNDYARDVLPIPENERDWDNWLATSHNFWHINFPSESIINPYNETLLPFKQVPLSDIIMPTPK